MLKEQLENLKVAAAKKISPEIMKKMLKSRMTVEGSGILDRTIRRGEIIPDFSLPDTQGKSVALAELRAHGPVLITLYRGVW
ncbi:MAG: hypothetical protein K0A94_12570 [Desulfuromonadales bacterium]|nr:hypothetical protein [Desulfuromonadales bacterium]